MSNFWKIVSLGAMTVLLFDIAASLASKGLGFPYAYASIGSVFIYALVGYFTFRRCGLVRAVGAAVLIEIVDATLGWYISWQIGPGALPADQLTPPIIATTIMTVLIFAAICALIGSAIARVIHGPRTETNA